MKQYVWKIRFFNEEKSDVNHSRDWYYDVPFILKHEACLNLEKAFLITIKNTYDYHNLLDDFLNTDILTPDDVLRIGEEHKNGEWGNYIHDEDSNNEKFIYCREYILITNESIALMFRLRLLEIK